MENKFKLQLFNFNKNLVAEQLQVSQIVMQHLNVCDMYSEKELYNSLKENLKAHTYDVDVKNLLENLEEQISADSNTLTFNLKDLYKKLERKNDNCLLRQPLKVVLEILAQPTDDDKMRMVLNELAVYSNFSPDIAKFLYNIQKNPMERHNMKNIGDSDKIYAFMEKADKNLVFIIDRWFIMENNRLCFANNINEYVENKDRLKSLFNIPNIFKYSRFEGDNITFNISEDLSFSINTNNKSLYINGEKLPQQTKLEDLFNTGLIQNESTKAQYYMMMKEAYSNLDKFVEMDNGLKITNIGKPFSSCVVIDMNESVFYYEVDAINRTGSATYSNLYEYKNVAELIPDVQRNWDFDLTEYFKNKLSEDFKKMKNLEDTEKTIKSKIEEISESIETLKENQNLFDAETFEKQINILEGVKATHILELNKVKGERISALKKVLN